jgi:hypothetical protein
MKLCFDTLEEVKDFVKQLKGTRGGKGDKDDDAGPGTAPAPIQPPAGQAAPTFAPSGGFVPPGAGATQQGAAFPAANAGPAPEIMALVQRISARVDSAIQSGQPADQVLTWFRTQCGPEAATATMDQIKQHFLPRAAQAKLDDIAKLMAA